MSFNCNNLDCTMNINVNLLRAVYVFTKTNDKDGICKKWILIDTFSTAIVSNNRDIFMNVQACEKNMS